MNEREETMNEPIHPPQCLDLWTSVAIVGRHQTSNSRIQSITFTGESISYYELGSIEVFHVEQRIWLRNPPHTCMLARCNV